MLGFKVLCGIASVVVAASLAYVWGHAYPLSSSLYTLPTAVSAVSYRVSPMDPTRLLEIRLVWAAPLDATSRVFVSFPGSGDEVWHLCHLSEQEAYCPLGSTNIPIASLERLQVRIVAEGMRR